MWTLAHELDERLLLQREIRVQAYHFPDVAVQRLGAPLWRRGRAELVRTLEREGLHLAPIRREEARRHGPAVAVGERNRHPADGVDDLVRGILRCIPGGVGVRLTIAARLVAELVGAVVTAVFDDRFGGGVAHALRRVELGGAVVGVEAFGAEPGANPFRVLGIDEDERAIRRVSDRRLLVGLGSLARRPAQPATETRTHGDVVVSRPGV